MVSQLRPVTWLLFLLLTAYIHGNNAMVLTSIPSNYYPGQAAIICNLTNFDGITNNYALINAKKLYQVKSTHIQKSHLQHYFIIDNITLNNRYSIAFYGEQNSKLNLLGLANIDVNKTSISLNSNPIKYPNQNIINYESDSVTLSKPIASVYYSVWNTLVTQSFNNITYNMQQMNDKRNNGIAPNVDDVIASNGSIKMYDLIDAWSWTINASLTNSSIKPVYPTSLKFWHQLPDPLGYYCIYNDPKNSFGIPNCSNITQTLTEHAYMLTSSGIDFVVLDMTNHWLGPEDYYSWIWQIRPTQVLYETWNAFRKNGTNTPAIVAWNPPNGTQYLSYLDLYNKYPNMLYNAELVDGSGSKYLYFCNPSGGGVNQTIIDQIENNNGSNNILVIQAFVTNNISMYADGFWTYMTPCRTNRSKDYYYWTSSLETLNECNQLVTTNMPIGSQMSTSFQYIPYDNPWSSLPFASPTKLNGRTVQLSIGQVLDVKPDYIMFPSFNEQHCGDASIFNNSHGGNIYGGNNTWSVGLYPDLKYRNTMYMDSYTAERSRVIEPSVEMGDYYLRLMASCVRVARLSYYFGDSEFNGINRKKYVKNTYDINELIIDRICNIQNEICCNPLTKYNDVWSIKNGVDSADDYILSNNYSEVIDYINNKKYTEICVPAILSNSSVFCNDDSDLNTTIAHRGPFVLYQNGTNPSPNDGSKYNVEIKRVSIYRCIDLDTNSHLIGNDKTCNNNGTNNFKMELLLGYAAMKPSSAMARQLIRCQNAAPTQKNFYYHVVDDGCDPGDTSSQILGYVL